LHRREWFAILIVSATLFAILLADLFIEKGKGFA
jgi:hypothetical protein